MAGNFLVDSSPHIHSRQTTRAAMWSVVLALLPSGIAGIYLFGLGALWITAVSIISCVVTEAVIQKLGGKKISIHDGSAVLTGLLLAYNLSPSVPLWMPVIGGIFAIAIVKQAFGGLGMNIFNPALAARAFLMTSWPKQMTSFVPPFAPDAITSATPLMALKEGHVTRFAELGLSYWDMFIGKRGGCIGEVCIAALCIGALYLLLRKIIWWQTPVTFILTVGLLSWAFGGRVPLRGDFLFSILSGGLVLGAFFMATDYVTTPLSKGGQLVFGFGCGVITFVIRKYGGYPEGVSYAILMMNAAVPLIDRYIKPRRYGTL
ncbi:MAG TPA: RnfABCDGE type electron transport complex subunit D [Candidatus Omnitrophota bacterium]|nr:RnfABCDGE type electron transport complex subunit D [Candidatus Omnitrophota bacterium]HPT07438.1 RnfABCDGE type electron transport complex subunit D [Candidatus Omnitrophota bacterium]